MSTAPAATTSEPEETSRYLVTYELLHSHRVTVGLTATDEEAAEGKARELFDQGRFWDDTNEVPLISDAWEEEDQGLEFEVRELWPSEGWPEPDYSVGVKKAEQAAYEVANRLIDLFQETKRALDGVGEAQDPALAHSLAVADLPAKLEPLYELALKACPRKATQQEG